jgi:ribosomal protein L44E
VLAFAFCNFKRRTWEDLRAWHVEHLEGPTVVTTATLEWVTPAENRKREAARLAARKSKRARQREARQGRWKEHASSLPGNTQTLRIRCPALKSTHECEHD